MTKKLRHFNMYLIFGILLTTCLAVIAVFGEWLDPYEVEDAVLTMTDPNTNEMKTAPFPPSLEHPFGTDRRGIDVLSQLFRGAKYTLFVVVVIAISRLIIALPIGLIAGWWTKVFHAPLSYVNRVWGAIPLFIIVYLILHPIVNMNLFPSKVQIFAIWLILTIAGLPPMIETIRGHVDRIRTFEFMEGVKVLGASPFHTMRKHIFPHLRPHLVIILSLEMAQILWLLGQLGVFHIFVGGTLAEYDDLSDMTYFYSVTDEWAGLLGGARRFILVQPWLAIGPAVAFFFGILSFSFLAEGLKKWMDKDTLKYDYQ